MKNTGIVRRVDEMGRIVIPKEIRDTFRIKHNDNLEIYIENNEKIVLRKHSVLKSINDFAQEFIDSMGCFFNHNIIVTDTKDVIAASGEKKSDYLRQEISKKLEEIIIRRNSILEKYKKEYEFIKGKKELGTYTISLIIVNGDVLGTVIIFSNQEDIKEVEEKVAKIATSFLGKYLEQ